MALALEWPQKGIKMDMGGEGGEMRAAMATRFLAEPRNDRWARNDS